MKQHKHKTKSDMVCCLVREDIIKGVLRPGTRLLISNVAKQYGVSEIPVREAFGVLVQDGFINTAPNTGFVVSSMSSDDVREIFEIRINLESLAGRNVVQHLSNADISRLEAIVQDSRTYIEARDFDGYWQINRVFHHAIYELCGNQRLYNMIQDLYSYSTRYPSYYTKVSELENSVANHLNMLEAYRKRDEDLVEKLTRQHTVETYQHVLRRLEEDQ